jgi:hypothetical protein
MYVSVYSLKPRESQTIQVDAFVVVHAGRAAEETGSGSDIWSVKWQLPVERKVNGECASRQQSFRH